jgi:hypothetical protein
MNVKPKVLSAVFVLFISTALLAAPSYDGLMDWTRGDTGSTWQEWTFDDADNPAVPENFSNPGIPTAVLDGQSSASVTFGWKATWEGRTGVWAGDPIFVDLIIPNFETDNPVKKIWFEMDYLAVSMLAPTVLVDGAYQVEQVYADYGLDAGQNEWRTMVIGWEIYPNPYSETITFALAGTGGFVDRISVDTQCVPIPAPGAILLGSLGVLLTGYMKRRNSI